MLILRSTQSLVRVILNLHTAHLQVEEELGLLLPCNVIVYEKDEKIVVSVFDPIIMTLVIENPEYETCCRRSKE